MTGWPQAGQAQTGISALLCLSMGKGEGRQSDGADHRCSQCLIQACEEYDDVELDIHSLLHLWREEVNWQMKRCSSLHTDLQLSSAVQEEGLNATSDLKQFRSCRVSGMAWVNKSSDEVCPFMHNKQGFVVLATAWRCYLNSLFWCCQGDRLSACPRCCGVSPALQSLSWLQLQHSPHQQLIESVAPWTDLNWFNEDNVRILTSVSSICTRENCCTTLSPLLQHWQI